MIPVASPLAQYRAHDDAVRAAILRVLESGHYILGTEVEAFEQAFAEYCGGGHAVSVASGTDALILALKSLGIGPGHEVITVSHTAVATVAAILAAGATPVLIDVEETYMTLDSAAITAAITQRTKAVIAVHLYGLPVDLDAVLAVCRRHGLRLIEDCAQATGATYRGRQVGSLGDVGCFSFYPTKNLGAIGDGGLIFTADSQIAERARRLRQYGWDDARQTLEPGVNSRLDPLQAAILRAKLEHLDADNGLRAATAARYDAAFATLPITSPAPRKDASHVYHLYVIRCDERDRLQAHLAANAIGSAVHYPVPVHRQRGYAQRVVVPPGGLPTTDRLADRILSLPMYPELDEYAVEQVISAVCTYYKRDIRRILKA